ncbi:Rha family transcriptional regulator [Psychrobacter glaciei]|uniref:Rha family transcriptional regulator n=1 Tax=Psychrobacter glaciei TaxID=619771 RepID=UPI003F450FCC
MQNIMQVNEINKTMSSREIAQLCEKRHDHVCRDIDNLNQSYELMGLPIVGEGYYTHPNTGSQQHRQFLLTQEQCVDLITGYNREIRIRINRRWAELEQQARQPQIPQSFAEALQLAANQAKQLELAAPKVAHYDKVVDRHTLLTATQVGQKIGLSAVMLNRVLDEIGVYNKALKRGRAFKQWFIDKGLGEMKQTDMGYSQPLFSLKGEAWVVERLASEGAA